jgi:hypothetical protein
MSVAALAILPLLLAPAADKGKDQPKMVAVAYLKALDGSGKDEGRGLLLGGRTLTADEFQIPNWKIVDRLVQREEMDVRGAVSAMKNLDKLGASALTDMMNAAEDTGDFGMASISQEQADKLMVPTQKAAKQFKAKYPWFAYCARAGKDVYWHPANPWRDIIKKLGQSGTYTLEFHRFNVQEDTPGKGKRVWPLRVLRIKTDKFDSGWKVLPASNWDPDW